MVSRCLPGPVFRISRCGMTWCAFRRDPRTQARGRDLFARAGDGDRPRPAANGRAERRRGSRNNVFAARIVPFPSFSTKRIELEYQERLSVENFESVIAVPLRPDAYQAQTAGHLTITLELHSEHALADSAAISKAYPLQIRERTPNLVRAEFFGNNVPLTEDFRFDTDTRQPMRER